MENHENKKENWTICLECQGRGKRRQRLRKKVRLHYQKAFAKFEETKGKGSGPIRPKGHLFSCKNCAGTGLIHSETLTIADKENYPHVAIIGGGIGGVALAVACLHRGIPFTLYERDECFEARSQGYGLTLQQASKAIEGLGIFELKEGVISTRHVVHTTDGEIIGEWGMRNRMHADSTTYQKRKNVHIARQELRLAMLDQLEGHETVQWGHQLIDFKESDNHNIELTFKVNGKIKHSKSNLIVGADGIRSTVRKLLIGEENTPLRYLGCIAILGICPLKNLQDVESGLLDSATVFQTANGNERIYVMPYSSDSVMWQLSFPMSENEAKELSKKGVAALKEEAIRRVPWHNPIPQIVSATMQSEISGYPVYDRELLTPELLSKGAKTTLIGDAAHPMSPFKGQGANQAILDALSLSRTISRGCRPQSQWKDVGIRESVLAPFEEEMLARSANKVKGSADAAQFLHSEIVLRKGNRPRGGFLKD